MNLTPIRIKNLTPETDYPNMKLRMLQRGVVTVNLTAIAADDMATLVVTSADGYSETQYFPSGQTLFQVTD